MAVAANLAAVQHPPKRGLITTLCNHWLILFFGRRLHVRKMADWLLRIIPIWITNRNGIRRKIDSVEAIFASEEILSCPIYQNINPWLPEIRSFIDLGMNRGYFILYLYSATKEFRDHTHPLFGIGIEANPDTFKIACLNIEANGLQSIHARQGVVGTTEAVDFYINNEDTNSSLFPVDAFGRSDNHTKVIRVAPLNVQETWKELFDSAPCDLLKIDIEGAEFQFMELEADFVRTLKYVAVEYHGTPTTSRKSIEEQLDRLGFCVIAHETNTPTIGIWFAQSKRPAVESDNF